MLLLFSASLLLVFAASSRLLEDRHDVSLREVKTVTGGTAELPCDLSTGIEGDSVTLVIWYRTGAESPIYSVDARGRTLEQGNHWTDKSFGGRASFSVRHGEADLVLKSVNVSDAGNYKCRVDFKKSPTRNSIVNLTVIVPPSKLTILNELGEAIGRPAVGPFSEGASVTVTCLAFGGSPPPRVTWWLDDLLVDDSDRLESRERVENRLSLHRLDRSHAGKIYTCKAVNNDFLPPIAADVRIDMYLKVLDVRLLGENLSLSAGSKYEVACQASGSRPPASLTWWRDGQLLQHSREKTSPDGNTTVSTLTFVPTVEDLGKSLSCRGTNPHLPGSAREDTWTLDVHYAPQVTLTLGSNINASSIKEGVDVYFECSVKANPNVRLVTWKHKGRNLSNNASAGTIIANQTLVLQTVSRQSSGVYTCVASNSEGSGESNPFHLDVKYEPECKSGQQRVYGAARNEEIFVECEVDSNPSAKLFHWSFNNSHIRSKEVYWRTFEEGGKSVANYTPNSEQGFGTLLCWGRNELGPQSVPCVFHIVPAGKPHPPKNCTLRNKTQTSLFFTCLRGFDGGLPQEFTLEVYDSTPNNPRSGKLIVNVTSRIVPEFSVGGLEPGGTYILNVYSSNEKGKSNPTLPIKVTTLRPTQQEHRRNIPTPAPTTNLLSGLSPLIWISIGVVSGVSVVAASIVATTRTRGASFVCCCEADDEDTQHSSSGAESAEDPSKLTVNLTSTKPLTRHITDGDVLEIDERNPDVIPLTNDTEQTSTSDLAEGESNGRSWKSSSDLHIPQKSISYDHFHNFHQRAANKGNLAYEIPAPLDKWVHQMPWQGNIVLNKQNVVFVDPSTPNPIVLTTLSIEPPGDPSRSPSDVPLDPCILLKRNPEALLATIPENLQLIAQGDRTKLYNTLPSKARQQNAETQTPLLVRHKESAV